jgi:hypothetical protein
MKIKNRSLYAAFVATAVTLAFGLSAAAEPPREELVHAFILIRRADHDYAGHRAKAMDAVGAAGKELGLKLEGEGPGAEQQWKSDQQMTEARRLLVDARDKLERQDRDRVAVHLEVAIKEVDLALNPPVVVKVETPREELVHAYLLIKRADHDYAGHRAKAMDAVGTAGKELGLKLEGEGPGAEQQWKSDQQMMEARRLLGDARDKLERQDRDRVALHLEVAIKEMDLALTAK